MVDARLDTNQSWLRRRGPYRVLSWAFSAVTFVVGPIVGMTVNAHLGAAIWVASGLLALIPFGTHRNAAPRGDDLSH